MAKLLTKSGVTHLLLQTKKVCGYHRKLLSFIPSNLEEAPIYELYETLSTVWKIP